ncbi:MAG: 4Fe-4S dicluster domain-containing protein [Bacteroidota bacterium]|nr:4Fe-4S dicluster domain-containing protein [Bacteroidota bacterium]
MGKLFDRLTKDIRIEEGLHSCINCGTCTAICPAAEFYDYEPRSIVEIVQSHDDEKIEALLCSDTIWYCGECMSCKTRCPRGNAPGLIIMALRAVSQEMGYFVKSEKGRQQLLLKRVIGHNILETGYCVHNKAVVPAMHPEQGPVWEWGYRNMQLVYEKMGANLDGEGTGALRKIPQEALDELKAIFEVTGGMKRFELIEAYSKKAAADKGIEFGEGLDNEYVRELISANNQHHCKS